MAPSMTSTMITTESPAERQFNTMQHLPPIQDAQDGYTVNDIAYVEGDKSFSNPGLAKSNTAATAAVPGGTTEKNWAQKHKHQTVLQQHVSYWDTDHDDVIWPLDTWRGCRKWGWNIFLCTLAMIIINGGLSYPTGKGWLPDPFFRIYVDRIHRARHGSDSTSYDNRGRFRPMAFEEVFANYDRGNKGGLTKGDIYRMWVGQRCMMDVFGMTASALEWYALYMLMWPADYMIHKEDARMVFDGSIFQAKADEYAEKQKSGKKML